MNHPRSSLRPLPPQGGDPSGPAEPVPRRLLEAAPEQDRSAGYWQTVARRFVRDPTALVAGAMIFLLLMLVLLGPWLAPADPYAASMLNRLKPIGTPGYLDRKSVV